MGTQTVSNATDILSMSDDQIASMTAPPEVKEETEEEKAARLAAEAAQQETVKGEQGGDSLPGSQEEVETEPKTVDEPAEKAEDEVEQPPQQKFGESKETPPATSGKTEEKAPEKKEGNQEQAFDYEAAYKSLMAPLVANGKTIELRTPEELKQLAQMGANYTKKMQAIAPHRKVLLMLENNGLLDEGKLSYLIDLDKKNPEAIKKLIKEAGINPLDIDTEKEPAYQEGNHRVSDNEEAFSSQLDVLKSTTEGVATLQEINTWDKASKEVLWANPGLMETIHIQRANGIYAMIATEIERQKTLGTIPANVPFLHAYKAVGDSLDKAGAFAKLGKPEKTPVTTRTTTQKPAVTNSDKANAAAPTRSTPKAAKPFVNYLAMSDEEFEKSFSQKV